MQKINEVIKGLIKQEHEYADNQKTEFPVKDVVPTGFTDIDKSMQGGLKRGELVVIGARPSMGKTSFVMNVARNVAVNEQMPVAFFSLETTIGQLVLRMLASEAGIDQGLVKDVSSLSRLKKDQLGSLINVSQTLSEAPLYIDDTPEISPRHIHDKLCRLNDNHKIGLVVIDYLQLMSSDSRAFSKDQEISEISAALKALAQEFNTPVVVLSQLSRSLEDRRNKRPQLADFRESGAIEKEANTICLIYRDEVYNPDTPDRGVAEIITTKSRTGPVDTIQLRWYPKILKFESLSPHQNDLY